MNNTVTGRTLSMRNCITFHWTLTITARSAVIRDAVNFSFFFFFFREISNQKYKVKLLVMWEVKDQVVHLLHNAFA